MNKFFLRSVLNNIDVMKVNYIKAHIHCRDNRFSITPPFLSVQLSAASFRFVANFIPHILQAILHSFEIPYSNAAGVIFATFLESGLGLFGRSTVSRRNEMASPTVLRAASVVTRKRKNCNEENCAGNAARRGTSKER